jgi:hypothetical protein
LYVKEIFVSRKDQGKIIFLPVSFEVNLKIFKNKTRKNNKKQKKKKKKKKLHVLTIFFS